MKVQDVMCCEVEVCRAGEDLNRVAQLLWDHDIGVVPVIDPSGLVLGMITDRDVCMAAYTQGQSLASMRVDDVMSRQVESCSPGSSLETALSIMKEGRVRRLPVIDSGGLLVGILSLTDLAREAALESRRGDLHLPLEVAATLAVICESRSRGAGEARGLGAKVATNTPTRKVSALAG